MDAKVDGRPVTGRIGKPVEVEALWLAALKIGAASDSRWIGVYDRALAAFQARFWNSARGCLFDVIDVEHRKGVLDDTLRPNQILAVGGLPWTFLDSKAARQVVDVVESRLWTPVGLRTLEPGVPGYCGRYFGSVRDRDGAYHQGTVWPWLAGPFVEAWLRVRDPSPEMRARHKQSLSCRCWTISKRPGSSTSRRSRRRPTPYPRRLPVSSLVPGSAPAAWWMRPRRPKA